MTDKEALQAKVAQKDAEIERFKSASGSLSMAMELLMERRVGAALRYLNDVLKAYDDKGPGPSELKDAQAQVAALTARVEKAIKEQLERVPRYADAGDVLDALHKVAEALADTAQTESGETQK